MSATLGWRMREAMRASSRNMVRKPWSLARCGRIVLTATSFSKPCLPWTRATQTVAMPPCA